MWVLLFLCGIGLCVFPIVKDALDTQTAVKAYADLAHLPQEQTTDHAIGNMLDVTHEEDPNSFVPDAQGDDPDGMQETGGPWYCDSLDDARNEGESDLKDDALLLDDSLPDENTAYQQYVHRMQRCLKLNSDFVAWLTIPNTPIDYPVVQSDRSSYYLHHLFTGERSKLGCLFSLNHADYDSPSTNIAIYGHHLSGSDAMFSSLLEYKDFAYLESHATIRLETLIGVRTYRIFAVCNTHVSEWLPDESTFPSEKHFQDFLQEAQARSLYDLQVPVEKDDHIVSLITCDRSFGGVSGRLVIMAVEQDRLEGEMIK